MQGNERRKRVYIHSTVFKVPSERLLGEVTKLLLDNYFK